MSRRGRPTTTGRSHNKRSNVYAYKRIVRELIREKKTKTTSALVATFLKPLSYDRQAKVTNADTTTTVLKLHVLIPNPVSKSEPDASQMSISESIETQRNYSDSGPQSVQSSNTPEILKENSFYSGTRISPVIDRRITDDKLSFTIKWEQRFTWAYNSSCHTGWFCRTCQEYSNSHDQYWKTVPRTHDQHTGVFFSEHGNCQKHVRAVTNKSDIKK